MSDLNTTKHYIKIPKAFRSSDHDKPFDHCMVCNKFLLEDGTPYMIEKAMRQHLEMKVKEVIFEYALCVDCAIMLNSSLSEESKQRISDYFEKHGNVAARREKLLQRKTLRVEPWINRCLITDKPISTCAEYQLMAQCDGTHLLFTYMPFALSMEALNEMTNLLSEKSLGEIDDFLGKYFSGPPEVAALLRKRSAILV